MAPEQLLSRSASALVDESAIEMTTADGRVLEIWTIESDGAILRASGPRLEVREGLVLRCRLVIDGIPRQLTALIERAEMQSVSRAALLLRVVAAEGDGQRRRSRRIEAAVPAILHPIVCDRLVPGQTLRGVIDDLSAGGVAVAVRDLRPRPNDRLRLSARSFEGVIDCELRVTSVRPGNGPGTLVVGCAFLEPSDQVLAIVRRLQARLDGAGAAARPDDVRAALGIGGEPAAERPDAPFPAIAPRGTGLASM